MRILVIEDEKRIAQAIKTGLQQESYAVDITHDGEEGYNTAANEEYDLIILDVMLPSMDGFEVCQKLRSGGNHTPILMLTAKDQTQDIVQGLDNGADDYLPKPFSFDVLLARIRALLRRPHESMVSITNDTAMAGGQGIGTGGFQEGPTSMRIGGTIGVVTTVNASSITIHQVRDDTSATYELKSTTTYTKDGNAAQFSDVKVGDTVLVRTDTSDSKQATEVTINPQMRMRSSAPAPGQNQSSGIQIQNN